MTGKELISELADKALSVARASRVTLELEGFGVAKVNIAFYVDEDDAHAIDLLCHDALREQSLASYKAKDYRLARDLGFF